MGIPPTARSASCRHPFGDHSARATAKALQLLTIIFLGFLSKAAGWNPNDEHPCNIRKLSYDSLLEQFGPDGLPPLYHEPIVITKSQTDRNELFTQLTRSHALVRYFGPDFNVTLSSSNSLSEHRKTMSLASYVNMTVTKRETTPNQRANESWYLFGETYSSDWSRLLAHYELPPCVACTPDSVALSFGIGNIGSGVQWHVHGPGFSEAIHGRKHWLLYSNEHTPNFHKDESSRQWIETEYPGAKPKPMECTLQAGELIYFPDRFWHATINLDVYTTFVSTFTQEHPLVMLSGEL